MIELNTYEAWFITGSQHLYGEETLKQVAEDAQHIAAELHKQKNISIRVVFKPILTNPQDIYKLCLEANAHEQCVGLIAWMHTFSPAKMWIKGLTVLQKPLLHLHTQFNRDIPWSDINMDFMNLNQSAHGGREFGFVNARMGIRRKIVVGHWTKDSVIEQINVWTRVVCAWQDAQNLKIARFGDNMREVAVTEGNKVSAQIQFGYSVNGYGLGDLQPYLEGVNEKKINSLLEIYAETYHLAESLQNNGAQRQALRDAARIELGLRAFLEEGDFHAFTDTFENLHGLVQLPGIAVQRLMEAGYGFGAEGDWKTAALLRAMKVMSAGLTGGTSFMEDYTYHFHPKKNQVLGAHMLEICPSIANEKPRCEIHPLGIGGKADPVRLVFDGSPGPALNASLIDLGHRFRLLVNEVTTVSPEENLPNLPVARVLWEPHPSLETAAAAWIYAGGAHHTSYTQALDSSYLEDFAEIAGIECIYIDKDTKLRQFRNELRWNETYYT